MKALPLLLYFLFQFIVGTLMAQTDLSGEYQLAPLPEIAAGFQLKKDSSFEFYFIYGAIDRYGKGSWTVEGNEVVLNSSPGAHPPFVLETTEPGPAGGCLIRMADHNPFLLSAIYAMENLQTQAGFVQANNRGELQINRMESDSVFLVSELFPEKTYRFRLPENGHRTLVFRLAPDAFEVFLSGIRLRIEGNTLAGSIPLLKPGDYRFNRK